MTRVFAIFCVVFLLTECTKPEKIYTTINIDGEEYSSPVMYAGENIFLQSNQESISVNGDSFCLKYEKTMTSTDGSSFYMSLRIRDDEIYQVGKKYVIPYSPDSTNLYNMASLSIYSPEEERILYYYAIDGWFELDRVTGAVMRNDGSVRVYAVDGKFSFIVEEEYSGDVIEVTNGKFHNTYFKND